MPHFRPPHFRPPHFRPPHFRPALALTALVASFAACAPNLRAQASELTGFADYVATAVDAWGAPGLAMAVVKNGSVVYTGAFGTLDLAASGTPEPVDAHSRFAIGSTTKAMTVAALGMLVDEGKLDWDDPVVEHLPRFRVGDPWVTSQMTIRDLLTHRGGMGNADFLWYERARDTEEIVEAMALAEPAYSMRSSFIYQNIMYAAAGEVIEAVSGVPWSTFVRQRIFEPLGMGRTVPLLAETVGAPNVARPHDRVEGRIVPIENASVDAIPAAGSVWSSVHDMSLWLRMLLAEGVAVDGSRILSEEVVDEMFRPQTLVPTEAFYPTQRLTRPKWMTYGLAWFQHDYRGHKVDFHTGSIDGMVAIAGLIRDLDLGVYVLANRDHVEVRHALMYRAFDHFLEGPGRDWSSELKELYDELAGEAERAEASSVARRVEATTPTHEAEAYVGTYADPLYGRLTVTLGDDGLRADYGPGRPGSLEHWSYDTFRLVFDARWRGSTLATFVTAPDGTVTAVRGQGFELRRVER